MNGKIEGNLETYLERKMVYYLFSKSFTVGFVKLDLMQATVHSP